MHRGGDTVNDAPPTFEALLDAVRRRVDSKLEAWLPAPVAAAKGISKDVGIAAEALAALTLRGGKRMRAALVVAGYAAVPGPRVTFAEVLAACDPALLAIELLQTYLLVHDDWMDDDPVRRGGPAVHVWLRERFGGRAIGDAGAVLVGDLASGYAQEALLASDRSPAAVLRAARVFARIQTDVVQGQLAEMCSAAPGRERVAVETVHALKTASYTVTGPLLLGAALAGGGDAEASELERFGRPLGIAFQLRDDVIGVFGDTAATGKPVGSDVCQGKQTSLVAALLADGVDAETQALLARTLGNRDARAEDVAAVVGAMESSGAKASVEARIAALSAEARAALPRTALAKTWLGGAIAALTERAA